VYDARAQWKLKRPCKALGPQQWYVLIKCIARAFVSTRAVAPGKPLENVLHVVQYPLVVVVVLVGVYYMVIQCIVIIKCPVEKKTSRLAALRRCSNISIRRHVTLYTVVFILNAQHFLRPRFSVEFFISVFAVPLNRSAFFHHYCHRVHPTVRKMFFFFFPRERKNVIT
jgi:hypothetical protein